MFILPIFSVIGKSRYSVQQREKKAKTVTLSTRLQAKGEMCTLQMGKPCYNATNIIVLVLVYVQNCKRAQSLVCHPTMTFLAAVYGIREGRGNTNTKTPI